MNEVNGITLRECCLYKSINNLIKFYIMRIVQKEDKFELYTKHGCVGEDNKEKIIIFDEEEDAKKAFNEKFEEKTGNKYEDKFIKKIDKYDVNLPDDDRKMIEPNVQYLLNIISNELIINKTLERMGIDPKRMPVEKINQLRITKAEEILHQLNLMQNNINKDIEELSEEYNRYIPYGKQIILNDKNIIATHINNIETIKNIYETYSCIIKNKKKNALRSKPEYVYEALGIEINMINNSDAKYQQVLECINRDHNKIKVLKVYEVCNKKQDEIFKNFTKDIKDKRLLFHGSPVTNWFSILKNGFYINPTQVGVPINGKAYGVGVYFSNHMSFSFPYCNMGKYDDSGVAILGLCEVALCPKSVSQAPVFVIFNTNQYTFRYLVVVENKNKNIY
jgi:poly [ADP-ribose] polymerase